MKIRWSIVLLALFGVVAALAAAVLTASLSAQGIQAARTPEITEVTVLVAAKDLAAMQTVTKSDVVEKVIDVKAAPGDYYSDPAQIVGKVLSLPVIEGQTYTEDNFPVEGSGLLLASHLPKGKRAVQVALEDYSGLEGLLYPGCIVDVVASFRVDVSTRLGRAVSTTLLQNIQVLGVQGSTVVDKHTEDEAKTESRAARNMNKSLLVTLMVDSRQAEALTLAMEHGTISLALRNPGDEAIATSEATLLAEGKLAQLAEMLAPKVGGGERAKTEYRELGISEEGQAAATSEDGVAFESDPATEPVPAESLQARNDGPSYWEVDVIRGLISTPTQIKVQD